MQKPFRIAISHLFPNCTFDIPPCLIEGNRELLETTKLISNLIAPVGYNLSDIRYIPCVEYSLDQNSENYSQTILGTVAVGNAEMSDYVMTLTERDLANKGIYFWKHEDIVT